MLHDSSPTKVCKIFNFFALQLTTHHPLTEIAFLSYAFCYICVFLFFAIYRGALFRCAGGHDPIPGGDGDRVPGGPRCLWVHDTYFFQKYGHVPRDKQRASINREKKEHTNVTKHVCQKLNFCKCLVCSQLERKKVENFAHLCGGGVM